MSFRLSLLLMVLVGLASLATVVLGSDYIGAQHRLQLARVEQGLVPKLELRQGAKVELVRLSRAFQDAVEAQDGNLLAVAEQHRVSLVQLIDGAEDSLGSDIAARLRRELGEVFEQGTRAVRSAQKNGGEDALQDMLTSFRTLERSFDALAVMDREELKKAFSDARSASLRSSEFRRGVGLLGAVLLLGFGYVISSQLLRRVSVLRAGFARFSSGNFDELIPETGADEVSGAAMHANQMAKSLQSLERERAIQDWVLEQQLELGKLLSGNLSPTVFSERALGFLSGAIGALAGTIYLVEDQDVLRLTGSWATTGDKRFQGAVPPLAQRSRDGLLGQATAFHELAVVEELPVNYFNLRSSLGSTSAPCLIFVPLWNGARQTGIIELAFLKKPEERILVVLRALQDQLAVSFEAARAREVAEHLHLETEKQAQVLSQQEEELRLNNQELLAQQDELRRANAELEEQREELGSRNREIERARERVQEKVEELGKVSRYKSQFLANMSHELRTPLNSMLLLSRLLADNEKQNLTPKQVEHCKTIHAAGRDLLDLINQVLDLSKVEAGKVELVRERVVIGDVCRNLEGVFRPLAEEQGLTLQVSIAVDTEELWTDQRRIERILTNLLGNAIKFTERGSVTLSVQPAQFWDELVPPHLSSSELVAFAVTDTGIGIPQDAQERVFAPFEQIDSTTARRYQGTGLGLTIARESAELLGGDIVLRSEPEQGSTFVLFVPWGAEMSAGEAAVLVDGSRSSIKPSDVPHLLVIEDDPVLAEQFLEIVESMSVRATVATTGEEGLRLAASLLPSGIVLDIKLPDIDGWTVMERLKSSPRTAGIPVHFLSALDAPEGALERGAVGYLTKPASRQDLREVVRLLAPRSPNSRLVLVIEDSQLEGTSVVALLEAEHYRAIHVASAEEALDLLRKQHFDCVLLDLGLPEMDGLGFLETLRGLPDFQGTRVIVHTGRQLSKQEVRQLGAYAQAIILKDGDSASRLIEEIRLFTHHVSSSTIPPPAEQALEPTVSISGARILIVEDDMRTAYSLSALLQSKGCSVIVADNGREGVETLQKQPNVDCVLMDIMMPEVDGYEAMQTLRRDPRFETLPIISLTAKAMPGERERCLAAGASDYLSKPVDAERLIAKIAVLLQGVRGGEH